jgi:hypothetical protein
MTDLLPIAIILGAATFGAVITLVAQLVSATRAQSHEVALASRRVGDLAELLKPLAKRLARLSALAEDSEPDLRRIQQSIHQLSTASTDLADNFARVGGWIGLAAPVVMAAVEGWAGRTPSEVPRGPTNGTGAVEI